MTISSSVYSSDELHVLLSSPYYTFSVFLYTFSRTTFAISFASFVFLRQFHHVGRRLFLNLVSTEIFAVLLKQFLFNCYFKAFSNNVYLWYMPFLVLACFNRLQTFVIHDFWLIRHLFGHSLACVFLFFCFYKCALCQLILFALVDIW